MTKPVTVEEWADEADRRIRELPDLPMDLSGLAIAPHIPGTLHKAGAGDSISSIMGSSDPGAIGAFMQANDMNGTAIRAGESYIVPERDTFTAPGAKARGQAGFDADNALVTQRARDRLDRGMAAIGDTVSGFDPIRGLLATKPDWDFQYGATGRWPDRSAEKYDQASNGADIASKVLDGFELQNKALGLLDGGRAAAKIGKVTGPLGVGLSVLENGLEGVSEYRRGAQAVPVVAGVAGKLAGEGLGVGIGTGIGVLASATPVTAPFAPVLVPAGGMIGGYVAERLLDKTSNEALGRKILDAGVPMGRYPYYDGGVGWPVFPAR